MTCLPDSGRRWRFAILRVWLALAATLPPSAGAGAAEPAWTEARSPHFTVLSASGPEAARHLATTLEELRTTLGKLAPEARLDPPVPIRVFQFADEPSFSAFRPAGVEGTAGFALPTEDGIYGALAVEAGESGQGYVVKQYVLYVLHVHFPGLPEWFRQGVAEVYSTFEIDGSDALVGRPPREKVQALRNAAENQPSLAELRAVVTPPALGGFSQLLEPAALDASGRLVKASPDLFYAQAWALIHRLVYGEPDRSPQVRRYLARIAGGIPAEAAFAEVWGAEETALDEEFRAYARREQFRYLRVSLGERPAAAIAVRILTTAEAESALGDLLLHTRADRPAEAAARFSAALAAAPELGAAWLGQGSVAALRGDASAAAAAFARAAALAPEDFRALYRHGDTQLATFGRRRPATDEEAVALRAAQATLARCTERAPEFLPCWQRLAFAYGLEATPRDEELAALERARELRPEGTDVLFNLLLAHARRGHDEDVRAFARELAARDADAATLARAREVELQLLFREATHLAREVATLPDSLGLYARIAAETGDADLRAKATERLAAVGAAAEHNRFVAAFEAAFALVAEGRSDEAHTALDALAAAARPGFQAEVVEVLRGQLPP